MAFLCLRRGMQILPTWKPNKASCKEKKDYFSPSPDCFDPGKSGSPFNLSLGKVAKLKT